MKQLSVSDIALALEGKKIKQGWIAKCPAHDDQRPSLSLAETSQGKILFYCHAGCDQTLVLAALKKRGLWKGGRNE